MPVPRDWADPVTETPTAGVTEIWEIYNLTVDAHPIHLHEVQFQLEDRAPIPGMAVTPPPPSPQEAGFIDTVIAYPGMITRVRVRFPTPGLFVWHCHIVEHEDNEMMRPLLVLPGADSSCPPGDPGFPSGDDDEDDD
jgi:bilirubin oxidase